MATHDLPRWPSGYHFCNVRSLVMSEYSVEGELGPKLTLQNIEQLVLDTATTGWGGRDVGK